MVNDKETIQKYNLSILQANQSKNIAIQEIRIANILTSNMMHPSVTHKCLSTLTSFIWALHIDINLNKTKIICIKHKNSGIQKYTHYSALILQLQTSRVMWPQEGATIVNVDKVYFVYFRKLKVSSERRS